MDELKLIIELVKQLGDTSFDAFVIYIVYDFLKIVLAAAVFLFFLRLVRNGFVQCADDTIALNKIKDILGGVDNSNVAVSAVQELMRKHGGKP